MHGPDPRRTAKGTGDRIHGEAPVIDRGVQDLAKGHDHLAHCPRRQSLLQFGSPFANLDVGDIVQSSITPLGTNVFFRERRQALE